MILLRQMSPPLSRFQDDKETYRREIKKIAAKNFEKNIFPANENFDEISNKNNQILHFQIFEFRYFNWEVTKWTQSGNMVSYFDYGSRVRGPRTFYPLRGNRE